MKFNSQICTSREQSERLLTLGLKKETADMHWAYHSVTATRYMVAHPCDGVGECIPAWSLHRLLMMLDNDVQTDGRYIYLAEGGFDAHASIYDNIIDCIEWLIKKGYFRSIWYDTKRRNRATSIIDCFSLG